MHGHMHEHEHCDCTSWESLTKKQKLEILRGKKEWLESKAKSVDKAIKELEKAK